MLAWIFIVPLLYHVHCAMWALHVQLQVEPEKPDEQIYDHIVTLYNYIHDQPRC